MCSQTKLCKQTNKDINDLQRQETSYKICRQYNFRWCVSMELFASHRNGFPDVLYLISTPFRCISNQPLSFRCLHRAVIVRQINLLLQHIFCHIIDESKKNVELIIQVNLLQELSQGITRYPTPALSQVWRCEGFHRVLDLFFSDQNCPSRIWPHVLTTEVDKISHWATSLMNLLVLVPVYNGCVLNSDEAFRFRTLDFVTSWFIIHFPAFASDIEGRTALALCFNPLFVPSSAVLLYSSNENV